jgi:hypothetical protein
VETPNAPKEKVLAGSAGTQFKVIMSSRDKLIIVYSKVGWSQLTALIGSYYFLSSRERKLAVETINDNDNHQTDPSGAHLFYFGECNTTSEGMQLLLVTLNGQIKSAEWFVSAIYDHGVEDTFGAYYNSSFKPGITRELTWEDHNAVGAGSLSISDPQTPTTVVSTPVNNYVCKTCGNNRCSKNEKSCWKCGNIL